jgi:hypothetical protein
MTRIRAHGFCVSVAGDGTDFAVRYVTSNLLGVDRPVAESEEPQRRHRQTQEKEGP